MEQVHIPNSFRNITLPNKRQYKLALLKKMESFISDMNWKAHFLTNNSQTKSQDTQEFYGSKTNVHTPSY